MADMMNAICRTSTSYQDITKESLIGKSATETSMHPKDGLMTLGDVGMDVSWHRKGSFIKVMLMITVEPTPKNQQIFERLCEIDEAYYFASSSETQERLIQEALELCEEIEQ